MNTESIYEKLCEDNQHAYGHNTEHLKILGGLYSDATHFIFEFLQNAEDANANSVYFDLQDDKLLILHNGTPFTENDVCAITKIARSTKDEFTSIGKFGLGFKSVYAITDIPEIHSNIYHFQIKNYILPNAVSPIKIEQGYTTLFSLPFKNEKRGQIFQKISERLERLNVRTLLFLHNIEDIKYRIGCKEGEYLREEKNLKNGLKKIDIIGETENESVLIFSKAHNEQKVEIAFLYDEKKNNIIPYANSNDTKLVVYFPTEKETKLGFLLNGNFRTTPSRENIPEEDSHNKDLINLAADLLVETMEKLKDAGLCNVSLLSSLPIQSENFHTGTMFFPLFERTKKIFLEKEYLPTSRGTFTNAKRANIARSPGLIDLLDGNIWISKEITEDRTRKLYEYLSRELNIPIWTADYFAKYISRNSDFLKGQSDEWFIKFYLFFADQRAIWDTLSQMDIIRTENNELRTKNDVFLPITNGSKKYPTVKSTIISNSGVYKFLEEFGLREPDMADFIKSCIQNKYNSLNNAIPEDEYKSDLSGILSILKGDSLAAKDRLRKSIRECHLIKCNDGLFRKIEEVYQDCEILKEWFKYSDNIHFEDIKLDPEDLKLLEIKNLPKRIETDDPPSGGWERSTREDNTTYKRNYNFDGLNDFIENLNIDNVKILSKIIYESYKSNKDFFHAEQSYFFFNYKGRSFNNNIFELLNSKKWILGTDCILYNPSEITKKEICEDIKFVQELPFDFKTDEMKNLEEKLKSEGKCIVDKHELDRLREIAKKQEILKKDAQKKTWEPSCKPDNTKIVQIELGETPLNRGIVGNFRTNESKDKNRVKTPDIIDEVSEKDKYEIGKWGEEVVKKHLTEVEKAAYIKELNDEQNIGTGRDLEVYKNGKLEKIIEVKSTIKKSSEVKSFKVSGKQWETARKEQDLYWIYIVFGVGTNRPEILPIQNPIKKWKNGEIEADPVNFIVRKQ